MDQYLINEINELDWEKETIYTGGDLSLAHLMNMVTYVDSGLGCAEIIGSRVMIRMLQQEIVTATGDWTSPLPTNFLGCPLVIDPTMPWGNRLVVHDPESQFPLMIYVNTLYSDEPEMTDERAAQAAEQLRKL